jgi:hypothetical protein
MNKLHQIAQGWYNFVHGSPEVKQMMDSRLRICETCPNKRVLNSLGQLIVKAIDDAGSVYYCGGCGCPLAGKTASPEASCPLQKWGPHTDQSYYP